MGKKNSKTSSDYLDEIRGDAEEIERQLETMLKRIKLVRIAIDREVADAKRQDKGTA